MKATKQVKAKAALRAKKAALRAKKAAKKKRALKAKKKAAQNDNSEAMAASDDEDDSDSDSDNDDNEDEDEFDSDSDDPLNDDDEFMKLMMSDDDEDEDDIEEDEEVLAMPSATKSSVSAAKDPVPVSVPSTISEPVLAHEWQQRLAEAQAEIQLLRKANEEAKEHVVNNEMPTPREATPKATPLHKKASEEGQPAFSRKRPGSNGRSKKSHDQPSKKPKLPAPTPIVQDELNADAIVTKGPPVMPDETRLKEFSAKLSFNVGRCYLPQFQPKAFQEKLILKRDEPNGFYPFKVTGFRLVDPRDGGSYGRRAAGNMGVKKHAKAIQIDIETQDADPKDRVKTTLKSCGEHPLNDVLAWCVH